MLTPPTSLTWFIAAGIFAFAWVLILIFGASWIIPILALAAWLGGVFLFSAPLLLLMVLIVIRMALDYSAQYLSLTVFDFTLSLSQFLGVAIAGLGAVLLILYRDMLDRFPLRLPFAILGVWGLATLAYSINPERTLQELLRFFDLFIVAFLAFVAVNTRQDMQRLLAAMFVSSLLPIAFGLYQFAFGIGLQDENVSVPRIFGTFSHPNVFSLYLFTLMAVAVLAWYIWPQSRRTRTGAILLLIGTAGALILTYARIAWVVAFLFFLSMVMWQRRLLLIPLLLIPLLLTLSSNTIQERVRDSFRPNPDSSFVWRQNLWHDLLLKSRLDDRGTLGYGLDTFPSVSESLRGNRFGSNDPHNDFVKFFVEGGIVGLTIFLFYLGSIALFLRQCFRALAPSDTLRHGVVIMAFLGAALIVASFSDNVYKNTPVQWLWWILLGGVAALVGKSGRELPAAKGVSTEHTA